MRTTRPIAPLFRPLSLALLLAACGGPELEETVIDPFTGEVLDAEAASVDMHRLMNDGDINAASSDVTVSQVQSFLNKKGGLLRSYHDPAAGNRSAADLIVAYSRASKINPVYMLAQIQTESSLVGSGSASNIPKATGCGCPDGGGCGEQYRGFGKQIQCAAQKMRGYFNDLDAGHSTIAGWRVGVAKNTSDPCRVTPANKATAALYTYTPWVGAYAIQCGRKSVGGSSLLAAIYRTYRNDSIFAK